jgi:hypothetical protein
LTNLKLLECSLSDYFHSLLVQNSQLMQIVNDSIFGTPTSLFLAFPEDLAPPNPPPIRRPGFTHHDRLSSVFLHQARQARASTVPPSRYRQVIRPKPGKVNRKRLYLKHSYTSLLQNKPPKKKTKFYIFPLFLIYMRFKTNEKTILNLLRRLSKITSPHASLPRRPT